MQGYLEIFSDLVFGFVALFVITKVLGKTQISQITAFDFVSAVILGELIGNALFDPKSGIPEIAFVVFVWGLLMYIVELITQKFKGTRHFLEGGPTIIIYNGQLIRDEMKKSKLDINQLRHLLREKDVFSISEVEYAILETDGTVSVLKKSAYQTPTRKDLKLANQEVKLSMTIINDGELIEDNLREKNLNEEWLQEQLEKQGFTSIEEVFYAEYTKGEDLFIVPFVHRNHKKWDD